MADKKISNLFALGESPSSPDLLALVDMSENPPVTKKLDVKWMARDTSGLATNITGGGTLALDGSTTSITGGGTLAFTGDATISNSLKDSLDLSKDAAGNPYLYQYIYSAGVSNDTGIQFTQTNSDDGPRVGGQNRRTWYLYIAADTSDDVTKSEFKIAQYFAGGNGGGAAAAARLSISTTGLVRIGEPLDDGQLMVKQANASGAIPVLNLEQSDTSEEFVKFVANDPAVGTDANSLTEYTTAAAKGHLAIDINGVRQWLRYYDTPS